MWIILCKEKKTKFSTRIITSTNRQTHAHITSQTQTNMFTSKNCLWNISEKVLPNKLKKIGIFLV